MDAYVVYEKNTGKIICLHENPYMERTEAGLPPENAAFQLPHNYDRLVGFNSYIKDNELISRPSRSVTVSSTTVKADGLDEVVVFGLEPGSSITITGPVFAQWNEADDTSRITTNIPGRYTAQIDCWPYRTEVFEFDAI